MQRDVTRWIHFVLDELVPPVLRDAPWFSRAMLRLGLGARWREFDDFKDRANAMSAAEFAAAYARTAGIIDRPTDLNRACIERLLRDVPDGPVLEVGAGRGHLAGLLAARHQVTALDMAIGPEIRAAHPGVAFVDGDAEALPFGDASFPSVVCTHTLEHVRDLPRAIAELRRVCAGTLFVVVPRQRPYRHTFDLHLHFFPHPHSLINALRPPPGAASCEAVGGDLYYVERRGGGP